MNEKMTALLEREAARAALARRDALVEEYASGARLVPCPDRRGHRCRFCR